MSTHIVDAVVAVRVTEEHGRPVYLVAELGGDNNVTDCSTGRRARNWCASAIGEEWEVVGCAARSSASCAGGMLRLAGRSETTPEAFIRAYRKALSLAFTMEQATHLGLGITLRIRLPMTPTEDQAVGVKYRRQDLAAAGRIGKAVDHYGTAGEVFSFDCNDPADVALWLKCLVKPAWDSAEVDGPERGWALDNLLRAQVAQRELVSA